MNRKLKLKIRHNIKLLIALSKVGLIIIEGIIAISLSLYLIGGLTNRILNAFLGR